ncbi:MAG: LLM class flavin-dependent oxidoreductase [Candidatus Nitrosopumilus sp. MTA1]|uniref:LLM class flavin-dependent oxidoreductase n=2 Tax=Marine Group I thaumarchaeote TaxID=2511932 RepID=A0A7K4MWI2_9ARCH|nr:LLM class flavin-dependent oxidoreductase [Candidatus Nitrosopumilus sp. MTA1]NWJ57656.1 LLM class flavin-dependent oxidoreductase [Marine Group I thaumarchaeote]NWK01147.1 LLM class flavin-dependent oxidoreductase [Marine Group I thaumarchaeote]NWK09589.1 LLM class flavin-dependent oxidoreductase [Marine Group I thaumarchaeote]
MSRNFVTMIGIELGIRAPAKAIERAAQIADDNSVEYFFVPETHPGFFGVNALEVLSNISKKVKHVKLGTGIINVFSRTQEEILDAANHLHTKTGGKFVLGIGTSAPIIIKNLWNMEFKKPLSRLRDYSNFIKTKYSGPIYWAAVGEKTTKLAAENADGVIFFLKPRDQISNHIDMINSTLKSLNKSEDEFNVISILPTFFADNNNQAKMTLASYIGANEFYAISLTNAGFQDEVEKIKNAFEKVGLWEAMQNVGDVLLDELTVSGSVKECKERISKMIKNTKLKTVILGFDLPEDKYTDDFFEKLDKLLKSLQ